MRNAVGDIVPTYRPLEGVPQLFLPIRQTVLVELEEFDTIFTTAFVMNFE